MMTMTERHNILTSIIFKTRSEPCEIALRADIKKLRHSTERRRSFAPICSSHSADWTRIQSRGAVTLRFTDDCPLKTDDSQRSCSSLFPYGTRRSSTTGLLEQMP